MAENTPYPLDLTGLAATNLIKNERHKIDGVNFRDYFFVVPKFAPFFLNRAVVTYIDEQNIAKVLKEGRDYYFSLPFIGASRSIGVPLYGAVALSNTFLSGQIALRYQTLGGIYTTDPLEIMTRVAEMVYNPRISTWDEITNKPLVFPPVNHSVEINTLYGQKELIDAINNLATVIATTPPNVITLETNITQLNGN